MDDLSFALLTKPKSEVGALGSIVMDPTLIKGTDLKPEHFFEPKNREIFSAMKSLDAKGLPIELASLLEEIGLSNLGRVGGISYLSEITESAFSTVSFNYHQELLIEYHKKRKIYELNQKANKRLLEESADQVLQGMDKDIKSLESSSTDNDMGHIKDILQKTFDWMEEDHGTISGAETGFAEVDELTSGLQRQDLVIVGARPSVGKTAFALNLANNTASKENPVAIFSAEMKDIAIALRMISNTGNISGNAMKNPFALFGNKDWEKSAGAIAELSKRPIHILDKARPDLHYIYRKVRGMKRLYPNEHLVVIIDYLQLIKGDPTLKGNRTQEIGDISSTLKAIAREFDCTVVALSQLSRKVEERADKRPMLSDLRESGQIEQDADVIQFLYRDDYYNADSEDKGIIEVNTAKQRNGPTGIVKLLYVKEYSKFLTVLPKM